MRGLCLLPRLGDKRPMREPRDTAPNTQAVFISAELYFLVSLLSFSPPVMERNKKSSRTSSGRHKRDHHGNKKKSSLSAEQQQQTAATPLHRTRVRTHMKRLRKPMTVVAFTTASCSFAVKQLAIISMSSVVTVEGTDPTFANKTKEKAPPV